MPAGSYLEWGGQFENLASARERLMLVMPACFVLVLLLLRSRCDGGDREGASWATPRAYSRVISASVSISGRVGIGQIRGMEEWLRTLASTTALGLELVVVVTVLIGAGETFVRVVLHFARGATTWSRREAWMSFARWILLALEFALGADIIRTAIAPSWDDIGKLAAIAAIRTGLGYFLERDIEEIRGPSSELPPG